MTTERSRRVYRPKAERKASAAKATIAAVRLRDALGHFLPVIGVAVRPTIFRGGEDTGLLDFVAEKGPEAV